MPNGTVTYFNEDGGYGFIDTEAVEDDVFFPMQDLGGPDAEESEELEFEITQEPKGPRATDIRRP